MRRGSSPILAVREKKYLSGVLVHRVARPLRGSVSCGSGWSVPCVSIQLTLSQKVPTCVSIQLTLSQKKTPFRPCALLS